jgi:hypothetical protein
VSEHWPDDVLAVVGLRVEGPAQDFIIPGSVHKACQRCESLIWASPATLASIRGVKHGFLCMECALFLRSQEQGESEVMPPSPEQIEELRRNLPPRPEDQ